jgi:catechol 2,3-dioxygenase-like lactoylglutathione lyase family enzyme
MATRKSSRVLTGRDKLGTATIIAFVATVDADRATLFYCDTLGLPLVADDPFAVVFDCNGIELRVQKVQTLQPQPFTALGWTIANIRGGVAALGERGVAFERFPFLEQDDLGIWQSPSGAKIAWFKDPDGNLLSLTERAARPARARPVKPRRSTGRRTVRTARRSRS